jgi:hypothetical protein
MGASAMYVDLEVGCNNTKLCKLDISTRIEKMR